MSDRSLPWLMVIALWCSPTAAVAGLFDDDSVLPVEIEGPIDTLIAQKKYPATRAFQLRVAGTEQTVGVRVRGKSRLALCDFPPLSLDFGEAGGRPDSPFAGLSGVKLVSHCFDYDAGEANALSEYAVYHMLALLTQDAYRVRLLRIRYIDNQNGRQGRVRERHGFVLEPQQDLADRVGGDRVKVEAVSLGRFDPGNLALVYVFQYLVGNTDWSLVTARGDSHCCHNGDLVGYDGSWHLVPYDFDQAGLVDARYARPDPSLRIKNVRQRVYRGFCKHGEGVPTALSLVVAKREELLGVIDGLPMLDDQDRERRRDYLLDFFRDAENPGELLAYFDKRCLE